MAGQEETGKGSKGSCTDQRSEFTITEPKIGFDFWKSRNPSHNENGKDKEEQLKLSMF
jgi:hypothetical protein